MVDRARTKTARISTAIASTCAGLVALSTTAVAPASAAVPDAVYQGMPIVVEGTNVLCTIGYNDIANHRSYTAAHCGDDGAKIRLLDPSDHAGRSPIVGTLHTSARHRAALSPNDWAHIEWDPELQLASNNITGDTIIHPSDVRPGEKICFHGATTHQESLGSHCGVAAANFGNEVYAVEVDTQPGDSGGPVFIPGRGMVGVLSGQLTPTLNSPADGGQPVKASFLRATYPEDGPADTVSRFRAWALYQYLPNRSNPGVVPAHASTSTQSSGTPGPTAAPYEAVSDEASQDVSTDADAGSRGDAKAVAESQPGTRFDVETSSDRQGTDSAALSPGALFGYVLVGIATVVPLLGSLFKKR